MADERSERRQVVVVEARGLSDRQAPQWWAQCVLLASSWNPASLESVHLERKRAGSYELVDFVLTLIGYAVSGERSLPTFYAATAPIREEFAALWGLVDMPSESALNRALGAVTSEVVEAVRSFFSQDLVTDGVPMSGGLIDRCGGRWIGYDGDGTRETKRARAVVTSSDRPRLRRRGGEGRMARGYTGRRRGEAVRTRMVVQQAHSFEMLGTFGHAGNGDRLEQLDRTGATIAAYMRVKGGTAQALIRLDGAHGRPTDVLVIQKHQVRFVTRATTPSLLQHPRVLALLAGEAHDRFKQVDTGTEREVFDVGFLDWSTEREPNDSARARMIVTRRTLKHGERCRVGYRRGAVVFELFATDLPAQGFTACDVLDMYFMRGGFEHTLGQEDLELASDRWVSGNRHGQELWQIVCQWVWNKRIVLGLLQTPTPLRRTLLREAIQPPQNPSVPSPSALALRDTEAPPPELFYDESTVPSQDAPTPQAPLDAASPSSSSQEHCCEQSAVALNAPASSAPLEHAVMSSTETLEEPSTQGELSSHPRAEIPSALAAVRRALILDVERLDPSALCEPGRLRRFGPSAFQLQPNAMLKCPGDKLLRSIGLLLHKHYRAVRFAAKVTDCQQCDKLLECMPARPCGTLGRRLTLPLLALPLSSTPLSPTAPIEATAALSPAPKPTVATAPQIMDPSLLRPPACGPLFLVWEDLPSASLRHRFIAHLRDQRVDVDLSVLEPASSSPPMLTRDQRAHRRLSWTQRLARNARRSKTPSTYRIAGLSPPLAARFASPATRAAA